MKIKRIFAIVLSLALSCSMFVGCAEKDTKTDVVSDLAITQKEETKVENKTELSLFEQRAELWIEYCIKADPTAELPEGQTPAEIYKEVIMSMSGGFEGTEEPYTEADLRDFAESTQADFDSATEEEKEMIKDYCSVKALMLLVEEINNKETFTEEEISTYQAEGTVWTFAMMGEAFAAMGDSEMAVDYDNVELAEGVTMTYTDEDGNTVTLEGNGIGEVASVVETEETISGVSDFNVPDVDSMNWDIDLDFDVETVEFTPLS